MAVASIRMNLKHTKLLVSQTGNLQSPLLCLRREAHDSSHHNDNTNDDADIISKEDMKQAEEGLNSKNVEELDGNQKTTASVLPEEVVEQSENFWAPDPETGVFVPAETEGDSNNNNSMMPPPHPTGNGSSVLDQAVFVREVEVEEVQIDQSIDQIEEEEAQE